MTAYSADTMLQRYRAHFGDRAASWIAERAESYGETIDSWDQRKLRAGRGVLGDTLDAPSVAAVQRASWLVETRDQARKDLAAARERVKSSERSAISTRPEIRSGAGEQIVAADQQALNAEASLRAVDADARRMREQGMGPEGALERAARALAFEARIEDSTVERTGRDAWDPNLADPLTPYIDAFGPEAAASLQRGAQAKAVELKQQAGAREQQEQARADLKPERDRIAKVQFADRHSLGTMREQRLERAKQESRVFECEARLEALEGTSFRPEVAQALRGNLEAARASVERIDRFQQSVWSGRAAETEAWLKKHGEKAKHSLALEYEVLSEVEQGLRDRGREVVDRKPLEVEVPASQPELEAAASRPQLDAAPTSPDIGIGF